MKDTYLSRTSETKEGDGDLSRGLLMRLELPSDPSLLCAVRGAVERLTESFGFTGEDCRAVTRAVDEALTNIIRHAYRGRADRPIEMYFRSVQKQDDGGATQGLEVLLCDHGPEIEPEKMCGRELDDVKPGGLGLHLIQQSMDLVEYKRAEETNCLRLVKYVRVPKKEARP